MRQKKSRSSLITAYGNGRMCVGWTHIRRKTWSVERKSAEVELHKKDRKTGKRGES